MSSGGWLGEQQQEVVGGGSSRDVGGVSHSCGPKMKPLQGRQAAAAARLKLLVSEKKKKLSG